MQRSKSSTKDCSLIDNEKRYTFQYRPVPYCLLLLQTSYELMGMYIHLWAFMGGRVCTTPDIARRYACIHVLAYASVRMYLAGVQLQRRGNRESNNNTVIACFSSKQYHSRGAWQYHRIHI
jgi:hypothetical protein